MSLTLIQVICISFVLRFEFLGFLEIFMTVFHLSSQGHNEVELDAVAIFIQSD